MNNMDQFDIPKDSYGASKWVLLLVGLPFVFMVPITALFMETRLSDTWLVYVVFLLPFAISLWFALKLYLKQHKTNKAVIIPSEPKKEKEPSVKTEIFFGIVSFCGISLLSFAAFITESFQGRLNTHNISLWSFVLPGLVALIYHLHKALLIYWKRKNNIEVVSPENKN